MRHISALFASLLLVAAAASSATADPTLEPPRSVFATMDSTGDPSKVDAEIAMSLLDDEEGSLFRGSVLGQFVSPEGFGGYAGIAGTAFLFGEGDETPSSLGDLQLGALFQIRPSPVSTLGVRAGLILPTASDDDFDLLYHSVATALAHPADAATVSPEATYLRLGVSPGYQAGGVYARLDAGVDVPVTDAEGFDAIGHVNVGIGFLQDNISGSFELQNAFTLSDEDYSIEERFIHTGAVSLRYHGNGVAPFLALSSPLDDRFRGEVLTLTGGLTAPL